MAEKTTVKSLDDYISDDFNMNKKVTVKNLADWNVGFPNIASRGDTRIAPTAKSLVSREELFEQINAGNKLLVGTDSFGSHATLYIEDEPTRKYVGFDSDEEKRQQNVITDEKIKSWFELKTQAAFEKNIRENVVTRAEKTYLLKAINRLKLNEHDKIAFCQEWCKFRLVYRRGE